MHEINVLIDFCPVPYVTSGTVSGFPAEKRCSTVQYSIKQLHKGLINVFNPSPVKIAYQIDLSQTVAQLSAGGGEYF